MVLFCLSLNSFQRLGDVTVITSWFVSSHLTQSFFANHAGEAVYVDDLPSPTNCLYGAFIYSKKPLARVKNVEIISKTLQGVAGVISFRDIPEGGDNVGAKTMFGPEPLFADDLTRFAGQPIAFVVIWCFSFVGLEILLSMFYQFST